MRETESGRQGLCGTDRDGQQEDVGEGLVERESVNYHDPSTAREGAFGWVCAIERQPDGLRQTAKALKLSKPCKRAYASHWHHHKTERRRERAHNVFVFDRDGEHDQ